MTFQGRLLAVDGTGLLVRCSRPGARRSLTADDGTPTGTLLMFAGSLARKLRVTRPDFLVIAWDGEDARAWRRGLYEPYKANRPEYSAGTEMRQAMEFCAAAGICQLTVDGFEADDVLAAVQRCACAELPGIDVCVCSDDLDMLQLAGRWQTVITGLTTDTLITCGDVEHAWGVHPDQLPMLRALAGDRSDNIPGLPGIGPAKALQMLRAGRAQWPLPEEIIPAAEDRDLTARWREIMELVRPKRHAEYYGMDGFALTDSAIWNPAKAAGVSEVLGKYQLSALSRRLADGRLW